MGAYDRGSPARRRALARTILNRNRQHRKDGENLNERTRVARNGRDLEDLAVGAHRQSRVAEMVVVTVILGMRPPIRHVTHGDR